MKLAMTAFSCSMVDSHTVSCGKYVIEPIELIELIEPIELKRKHIPSQESVYETCHDRLLMFYGFYTKNVVKKPALGRPPMGGVP